MLYYRNKLLHFEHRILPWPASGHVSGVHSAVLVLHSVSNFLQFGYNITSDLLVLKNADEVVVLSVTAEFYNTANSI
jgi:hypothetical protein